MDNVSGIEEGPSLADWKRRYLEEKAAAADLKLFELRVNAMSDRVFALRQWVCDRSAELADEHIKANGPDCDLVKWSKAAPQGVCDVTFHNMAAAEINAYLLRHAVEVHDRDGRSGRVDCPICQMGAWS